MDVKNADKGFIIDFIEAYRSFPCLWRIKSKEYKDRNKKNRAYEELLKQYKTVDSFANVQTVKTKIDSLRGSFRKEIKKMKESKRSGCGEDEIYKPHLWYFDHLKFLLDQETPRESISSLDTELWINEATEDVQHHEELVSPRSEHTVVSEELTSNPSTSTLLTTPVSSPSMIKSNSTKTVRHNKKRKPNKADEVLEKVSQQLEYAKEDKFDIIGKNLANKLRELPPDIAIVTEKMFNDIVFEAQMGNITRHTRVTLQDTAKNAMGEYYPLSMPVVQSLHNTYSAAISRQNSVQRHYEGGQDTTQVTSQQHILSTSPNVYSHQTVLGNAKKSAAEFYSAFNSDLSENTSSQNYNLTELL